MTKEKDERITKLTASNKELKGGLAAKEQESAGFRKQVGAAQRAEDELRKQQASAASKAQKEETQSKDAMARLRGTIEEVQTNSVLAGRAGVSDGRFAVGWVEVSCV